jgi:glycosyltransferase involved in cell wall biosynthesis
MILYTRSLVKAAINHFEISIMTTNEAYHDETFKIIIKESSKDFNVHIIDNFFLKSEDSSINLLSNQYQYYSSIKKCYNKVYQIDKPDFIYMVNLDHFDKILSLLGTPFKDTSYSGMLMNPKFHRMPMKIGQESRFDKLYFYLFKNLCKQKYLKNIMIVDQVFDEYLAKLKINLFSKRVLINEPVDLKGFDTRNFAREKLGINESDFVILVYGSLSLRKGLRELLNSFYELNIVNIKIIIAGKINNDIVDLFQDTRFFKKIELKSILFFPGFQDDESQYRFFKASDTVWLGYIHGFSGSSGVIYQAATMGLPVLASNYGLIGWLVSKYKIGLKFDTFNYAQIREAITLISTNKKLYNEFRINAIVLSESNTAELFGKTIIESIITHVK